MKKVLFLIMFFNTACSLMPFQPEMREEWALDLDRPQQIATFKANEKECSEYAFHAKIAGSRYTRDVIEEACLRQKGYSTRLVEVK